MEFEKSPFVKKSGKSKSKSSEPDYLRRFCSEESKHKLLAPSSIKMLGMANLSRIWIFRNIFWVVFVDGSRARSEVILVRMWD